MTLVERFIEVDRWPTCRKTMVFIAVALPAQLLASAIAWFALLRTGILDPTIAGGVLAYGVLALCSALACAWWSDRRARDGDWIADFLGVAYGSFLAAVICVTGTWSTPWFVFIPLGHLVLTMWFGRRTPWIGVLSSIPLVLVVGLLGQFGVLPYAPALNDDRVSSQNSAAWALGVYLPIAIFYVVTFSLSLLIMAARRRTEALIRAQSEALARSNRIIRAYVPAQVADRILSSQQDLSAPYERRKLTLFFSDLVGFTEISEAMEPEDLSRVLNEYFAEMTRIAHHHGGTVDELSGDAILVLFGAPDATTDSDHARAAVRMAVEMQTAVTTLNRSWETAGISERLRVRMGINTGVVTVGNFGSPERMKYAALGKNVNLAARIQAGCEPGQVLISHATWLLVRDEIACEPRGEMQFKGVHRPVQIFQVAEPAVA